MLKNFKDWETLNEGALPNVFASDFFTKNNKDFSEYENKLSNKYLITFMSEKPAPVIYLVFDNKHIIMKKFLHKNNQIKFYYEGVYEGVKYSLKIFKKIH